MRLDNVYKLGRFIGSKDVLKDARIVILGAPMDWTVTFRPGSRFGPERIRSVSIGLEEYSLSLGRSLDAVPFYDGGDLTLPFGDVEGSMRVIRDAATYLYKEGKLPFFLGGEHLITLPVVQAAASLYPDLVLLHFDAHMDLRDEYFGRKYSHASVMRRVLEVIGERRLFQFGIRSGVREEVEYARGKVQTCSVDFLARLKGVIDEVSGHPVYVSLDIDAVDPAYAPGTGTPEPGGLSSQEILEAVYLLGRLGDDIVGFDLVEVAPPYDHSDITSMLAARILREMLLTVGRS